jgi:hypothetical protein
MYKVPVASFAAAINKSGSLELGYGGNEREKGV